MGKYRVAVRDEINTEELKRYALRWTAFVAAALLVVLVAVIAAH